MIQALPDEGLHNDISAAELNLNSNRIGILPANIAKCKRQKVLRIEENTMELMGTPVELLTESAYN